MNIFGFLPEGKFSRILTEPVNRDPGSRRRGRRPRSEMPKPLLSVSDSASSGLGPPLFMNGGLIGSMDSMVAMQNLRGGIPGIPISGIMAAGFPHGFPAAVQAGGAGASAEDAKNGLSMLPMMLHGIPHPHGVTTTTAPSISAHLGASAGSHLTFNPFLIPGMSHGLLYPHMFLPHGGIMALPAMPPGAIDGSPGSPKRRRKRGREEGEREEEREKVAMAELEERESTVKASVSSHLASSLSPSIPSTSAPDPAPPPTEEPQTGQGDGEDGPSEPQEPDSHNHPEGAATEESEDRLEETGGEAAAEQEEKQETEEQRQVEGEEETA
uniref:Uncharacterized protein n=1 Tax=Seriola lalandi dorsalis TaxID=1841481 RepID=A0A3B4WV22_SERLL